MRKVVQHSHDEKCQCYACLEMNDAMHLTDIAKFNDQQSDPSEKRLVTYFVQGEAGGLIKIGRSDDIAKRISALRLGSPVRLVLIGWLFGDFEMLLHKRFSSLRQHGEWFSPAPTLTRFVMMNCRMPDPGFETWAQSRRQWAKDKTIIISRTEQTVDIEKAMEAEYGQTEVNNRRLLKEALAKKDLPDFERNMSIIGPLPREFQ